MTEDGQLAKIKDQYVDEILTIVPLSQACFIVLMVLVADQLVTGKAFSVLDCLAMLGLKTSLGPESGRFWQAGMLSICVAFVLALLNTFFLRTLLARSLRLARVNDYMATWQVAATSRVSGLTSDQRAVIHSSLKPEIETRLRRFRGKRVATEVLASIACVAAWGNVLVAALAYEQEAAARWAGLEFLFLAGLVLSAVLLHRASLQYAIAKILPLKVYAGVLTGELIFFEEISS